ncbi:unnamed protein product [Toxocara canis]|uniref:Uncharacterized protein n=1 Tax=Toxocara canis TaxID=6265 RepID=A0A183U1K8_TOXCA|nr:unnamed protein product [Toxocara canis]
MAAFTRLHCEWNAAVGGADAFTERGDVSIGKQGAEFCPKANLVSAFSKFESRLQNEVIFAALQLIAILKTASADAHDYSNDRARLKRIAAKSQNEQAILLASKVVLTVFTDEHYRGSDGSLMTFKKTRYSPELPMRRKRHAAATNLNSSDTTEREQRRSYFLGLECNTLMHACNIHRHLFLPPRPVSHISNHLLSSRN